MSRSRTVAVFAAMFIAFAVVGCNAPTKPEAGKAAVAKPETAKKQQPKNGKVVAEIGNEKITLDEVDQKLKEIPEQYQGMALTRKDLFLDSIINQKLLYAAAQKEGTGKDPKVQSQIEEATKEILIKAYLAKEIEDKAKVTDEDAKKYYADNKTKFKDPEKIKVFHVLLDNEADAKDVLAKLKAGGDFAALAKERSKCPSKEKGGELGLITKGQTVPEFEQAAFALQLNQLSEVVKTQFGYHIIKVTEKVPEKELSYDEVKDRLKQMLLSEKQKKRFEALLKDLRDKNKVTVYKDVLMPPSENKPVEPAKQGK